MKTTNYKVTFYVLDVIEEKLDADDLAALIERHLDKGGIAVTDLEVISVPRPVEGGDNE